MVHESQPSPRQRRRDATTERILGAAAKILEEEGLEALTMQRLAAETGFTVGATYRYFASKDEIIASLQRRVFEGLGEDLRAALARHDEGKPRPGKLEALVRVAIAAQVYSTLETRRPADSRLLVRLLGDPKNVLGAELGGANMQFAMQLGAQVLHVIVNAQEMDALDRGHAGERALMLFAALSGAAQMRKLERWNVPGLVTDRIASELVRTLLIGWGAEPARAKEALARAAALV